MIIKELDRRTKCTHEMPFDSRVEFIGKMVDIQTTLTVAREYHLTDREKVFFVACVVSVLNGYANPISEDAIQIYKKIFNFETNKKTISDYIKKLTKKKWLLYDKKNKMITIPPLFKGIDLNQHSFELTLSISLEESQLMEAKVTEHEKEGSEQ